MDFDAIVVGAGHAGIEAALALSRLGQHTLLVTQNLDTIGKMSCNPAIGGLAKGNMVREIDALGGQMGKLIDATMIQFRVLNQRKGPAVQSPRAQADKYAYQMLAKKVLEEQKGLELFMDTVTDFLVEDLPDSGRGTAAYPTVQGVVTGRGRRFSARTVVLTTGTFLNGRIFIGEHRADAGRLGEPAATGLDVALRRLGFEVGRMKTGTPARVHRDSIDLDALEAQWGDPDVVPFSFTPGSVSRKDLACYITWTTDETHRIIRENIGFSPLFSGEIKGLGPRYCPSIEDKVIKFPHRPRHQIFVEPEGADTREMYLNGMSSSLPELVQEKFIRSLPGFAEARIMRPGYAVEYDYLDPLQLYPSLETKMVRGLFVAGQTNGTSGYEEAAAQGLMAGINASRYLRGEDALVLTRAEAYIGVLIDDLVTMGTREPYRMFTSRAEHRISLRHDSADDRLFGRAKDLGLHSPDEWAAYMDKKKGVAEIRELLDRQVLRTAQVDAARERTGASVAGPDGGGGDGAGGPALDWDALFPRDKATGKSFHTLLRNPKVGMDALCALDPEGLGRQPVAWLRQVELDVKYEGYVARQEEQILRFRRMEEMRIPRDFDYGRITGLSNESREKLAKVQPASIGQASRINGVRNSDLALLMVSVARRGGQNREDDAVSRDFLDASKLKEAEAFVEGNRVERPEQEDSDGDA